MQGLCSGERGRGLQSVTQGPKGRLGQSTREWEGQQGPFREDEGEDEATGQATAFRLLPGSPILDCLRRMFGAAGDALGSTIGHAEGVQPTVRWTECNECIAGGSGQNQ